MAVASLTILDGGECLAAAALLISLQFRKYSDSSSSRESDSDAVASFSLSLESIFS